MRLLSLALDEASESKRRAAVQSATGEVAPKLGEYTNDVLPGLLRRLDQSDIGGASVQGGGHVTGVSVQHQSGHAGSANVSPRSARGFAAGVLQLVKGRFRGAGLPFQ